MELIRPIQDYCRTNNYDLVLFNLGKNTSDIRRTFEYLLQGGFDGAITFLYTWESIADLAQEFLEMKKPLVLIGAPPGIPGIPGLHRIRVDIEKCLREAVAALTAAGHKKIICCCEERDGRIYQKVRNGLRILKDTNGLCMAEYVFSPKRSNMETYSLPLVSDGKVFYGSAHGFFAHDAVTAKLLWKFTPKEEMLTSVPYSRKNMPAVHASPAMAPGMVIFGAGDGFLYVLDATNGKKLFSADLGAAIYSSPAVSGNTVVTAAADGTLFAFTGQTR